MFKLTDVGPSNMADPSELCALISTCSWNSRHTIGVAYTVNVTIN